MPQNCKQLRQFLGLAQYIRKFMQGFSHQVGCLTRLLRKDAAWHWTDTQEAAFQGIKQSLTSAPVLKLSSRDVPFTVVADASGFGIGAVLLQEGRPVAFDGRKLTDAELKWSATECEMLAVVYHLQKWRCYLDGVRFTVVTDHQPNTWFGSQKRLTPRLHRWYEQLRGFDFEWQYKPGRVNMADPISRHPSLTAHVAAVTTRGQAGLKPAGNEAATPAAEMPPREKGRKLRVKKNPSMHSAPAQDVVAGDGHDMPAADEPRPKRAQTDIVGSTPPVPLSWNADARSLLLRIQTGYEADPLYKVGADSEREQYSLKLASDALYEKGSAVAVPADEQIRRAIIRELHDSPYVGHFGIHRTHELISRYYWWPEMRDDIAAYVKGCVMCQRSKSAPGPKAGKLMPLPVPSGIWEDISMDFVGPLPMTARHVDFILVVVDRLSKMAHFLPCKSDITGPQVAELFVNRVWVLHGLPNSIVTDRGPNFVNKWNAALLKLIGTKHSKTSAYHPESDGQTERTNRVLGEMLRHYVGQQYDDWDVYLPMVEFAHNNAHSSATGSTPFFIVYGKHPNTPMDLVVDREKDHEAKKLRDGFPSAAEFLERRCAIVKQARMAMESARQRMLTQTDGKRRDLQFKVGDQVSLKTSHLGTATLPRKKLFPKWMGPFTVQQVVNEVAYMLELPRTWRAHNVFHVSLLKPFVSNGEPVSPMPFNLVGGSENQFEVKRVLDFKPKTLKKNGSARKVKDLSFCVEWLGLPLGADAWQPWANLKGTCDDALTALAQAWKLPADTFLKGSHKLPDSWIEPASDLPPPPVRR